jgi:hypothetical protein
MRQTAAFRLGLIAVVVSTALLLLAGCGSKPGSSSAPGGTAVYAPTASAGSDSRQAKSPEKSATIPRRIIYSADVVLAVENLAIAARDIEGKVKQYGGFVAGSELGAEGDSTSTRRTGTWKVRIPVAQFESFVKSLRGIGDVVNTKISSEDVSEEFYDVEARLRNKQAEEARLLQHLKVSTAQLSDILAVEREISRVREEIERIQGRLRFLANQTDLTTITIAVREAGSGSKNVPGFLVEISRTLSGSLRAMGDFGRGLILVVIAALPWLLVLSGIGLPFYLRRRRRQPVSAPRVRSAAAAEPDRTYEQ